MLFFMQDGFKDLYTSIYCIHTFLLICKNLMEDMTHSEYCIERYCSSIRWRNYTCCIYYHRIYIENYRENISGTELSTLYRIREEIYQGQSYLIYTELERKYLSGTELSNIHGTREKISLRDGAI